MLWLFYYKNSVPNYESADIWDIKFVWLRRFRTKKLIAKLMLVNLSHFYNRSFRVYARTRFQNQTPPASTSFGMQVYGSLEENLSKYSLYVCRHFHIETPYVKKNYFSDFIILIKPTSEIYIKYFGLTDDKYKVLNIYFIS